MNTKHTPAPWKTSSHIPYDEYSTIIITEQRFEGDLTAIVARAELSVYINCEQAEANAKLIAAAPELLDFIEKYYQFLNLDAQKEAVILINKATKP